VGDGLGADVTGGPEDAGADDLRAHRVRGQALLVPSPEPPHPHRAAGQARREQFHGQEEERRGSVHVPPFPLFISFFSLFFSSIMQVRVRWTEPDPLWLGFLTSLCSHAISAVDP